MPGEEEARVGSSAQLATTALTTTTTTTSGTGAASSSSSTTSSSSAVPKVALPVLALRGTSSSSPAGVTSVSSHYPLVSGTSGGGTSSNNKQQTTGATIVPISASCPPTTVNNNVNNPTALSNAAGAGILANLNSAVGCSVTVDGGVGLNNNAAAGATTASNNKKQQQSFHNNPLPGTRPAPLVESNSSGGLLNNFNNKQQQQIPHLQQPPSSSAALLSSQLSLKPLKVSTTPNGNSSSPPVADAKRDTGTCNGHSGGASHHGGKRIDDDEIDEADDSSKLELQLQFAGIDNETVDVDVEDEENNYEGGSESGPMCTVVPTSKSANGNGGDKPGTPSFPGDLPGGGGGTMVVASSAAAAGSAAPTSTTSSTIGGGGGATGPTNSLAAGGHVAGTTASAAGGSTLGEEEEDEEEDVEGGKTVECTEVVVPEQTFAEKCLFYTTAFFILLAVFSLFAFLFLVPFVIDPAFTTIFMEFDPEPAFCQTVSIEQKAGLSKCNWTSCREGCTREMFQCIQIRVNYRSARKSHSDDFQRRPNNNNNNNHNLNLRSASGGSSFSLALQDLRGSEHSGSSFKTPFTNNYNNLINLNSHKVRGGGAGSFGAGEMSAYHSASSAGGGGAASTSKLSKAHYKSAMASNLHHASKFAGHGAGDGVAELTSSALTSHNSASARSNGVFMNLKQSKHNRMPGQQLKSAQQSAAPTSGAEPLWDYTEAHLYPNVKGCGYPPVVVCSDFVDKYGSKGTNFSCYYSKVNPAMVVTSYDMSRVIMDLVYSMAIPIPSFIISVVYLIFAYFRIYNTDSSSATQTGGGGRAERLNSSSTTTNLQNPGSANRGGGGSSADDPDAETSISVDDKTCIIQRSTSKGLNALSDKLPNSGKGLHAQVIEMNDLNPQLRHPVDGDVFLPKRNNNCNPPPPHERNGPTNPAAKNKGEEMTAAPTVEAS